MNCCAVLHRTTTVLVCTRRGTCLRHHKKPRVSRYIEHICIHVSILFTRDDLQSPECGGRRGWEGEEDRRDLFVNFSQLTGGPYCQLTGGVSGQLPGGPFCQLTRGQYMHTYTYTDAYTYIYIYIYIYMCVNLPKVDVPGGNTGIHIHIYICIFVYIYIC